ADGGRAEPARRGRRPLAAGFAVLGALLALLWVSAAAGERPVEEPLVGCVSTATGDVRIVGPTAECRKGEFKVEWQLVDREGNPVPSGVLSAGLAEGASG